MNRCAFFFGIIFLQHNLYKIFFFAQQSISLAEREARSVWLGVGGGVVSMAAGAATKGIEMAAKNGQAISSVSKRKVSYFMK